MAALPPKATTIYPCGHQSYYSGAPHPYCPACGTPHQNMQMITTDSSAGGLTFSNPTYSSANDSYSYSRTAISGISGYQMAQGGPPAKRTIRQWLDDELATILNLAQLSVRGVS